MQAPGHKQTCLTAHLNLSLPCFCSLTGVNVWTHGELLPAHGYPALKKRFPHLVGNYGGAWYRQQKEFADFPGAIL